MLIVDSFLFLMKFHDCPMHVGIPLRPELRWFSWPPAATGTQATSVTPWHDAVLTTAAPSQPISRWPVAFPVFFWSSCPPIKPLRLGLGLFAEVWTWFLLAEYGQAMSSTWLWYLKITGNLPKSPCLGPSGSKPKSPWSLSEKWRTSQGCIRTVSNHVQGEDPKRYLGLIWFKMGLHGI